MAGRGDPALVPEKALRGPQRTEVSLTMSSKLTASATNGARHIVLPSFHKSVAMEPWGSIVDHAELTVVVVNYNTAHLLYRMFGALEAAKGALTLQVIVVDNASRDGSVEILRAQFPGVELIENSINVGFARANNQTLPLVHGRYLLLLNTDAVVSPATLQKTVEFMDSHPRCGVLGAKVVGPDDSLQPSCRYFPTPWNVFLARTGLNRFFPGTRLVDDMSWDHASVRECDWVPGCYYLVRYEVVARVGLGPLPGGTSSWLGCDLLSAYPGGPHRRAKCRIRRAADRGRPTTLVTPD